MARGKGNVHKMHNGYKRHEQQTSTPQLMALAQQEIAERLSDLMFEDMAADEEREALYDDLFGIDDIADKEPECDFGFDDSPYSGFGFEFDPFERDSGFDDETPRPEDSWQAGDQYDEGDRSLGTLRYYMEEVKPSEIPHMDLGWVASKYMLLTAMILGGSYSIELFNEPSALIGRYQVALEKRLRAENIGFEPYRGITESGLETIKALRLTQASA